MAFTATKKADGNFEVFKDGKRVSTGSEAVLKGFGLSADNLGGGETPAPATTTPEPTPTPTLTGTPLSNPSIVDFLNSTGQASDFSSRTRLARDAGILNYTGTADQNTRLLGILRQGGGATTKTSTPDTPQGTASSQEEIDNINSLANDNQASDLSVVSDTIGADVDVSDSSKIIKALVTSFEKNQKLDTPSLAEEFSKQRKELGVGLLETELAGVDEEIAKLNADFSSTIAEEDERQVSVLQIGRRQSQIQLQFNRAMRDLEVKRNSVVNQLNQKLAVVNAMVQFTGMDIDNAQQDYQNKFSNAISLTNLITGIEDSAKTDTERQTDNARANLQIMYNTILDGNVSYDDLDAGIKVDIKNMEIQAGLPSGFVNFISETIKDPIVSFLSPFTDDDGNRIQPVGTRNADGSFSIKNVKIGKAEVSKGDKVLSQSQLNKLAVAGVPEVVALDIQNSFNVGVEESTILAHLTQQVGKEKAEQYMEAFKSVQAGSGSTVIIPD